MSDLDTIYERNAAFAETFDKGDLPIRPNMSTIILSCVDARVEPSLYAGLDLGDALVMRTIGGRVTETVMTEVAMLWQLMKLASGAEPSMSLAVVHHTQCGMARFSNPDVAAVVSEAIGHGDVIDTYAIADGRETVTGDVQRALNGADTPAGLTVSGHMYDVTTGQLERVVDPVTAG